MPPFYLGTLFSSRSRCCFYTPLQRKIVCKLLYIIHIMWCLFSIILYGMTAVCYPWFFAVGCRSAASMVEWHDVRQGHGNLAYAAAVCRGCGDGGMVRRAAGAVGRYGCFFAAVCRRAASMRERHDVRQGDTAAFSQWVCRNAPPQKGL